MKKECRFGTWILACAKLSTRGSRAAELAEELILLLSMDVAGVVDRKRRDDASLQASQRAVGEGDAGREGAYDEAGSVAFLKRGGIGRGERGQH
ncbi:unnamed protein product [Citrullus colocynthis]|uniref:Uncharacterized protein n=1 Tax=Citrullus colocynthis TaxID=252529 RepID=A0ABP0XQM7_9ROSI